jgi:hypothetical protein
MILLDYSAVAIANMMIAIKKDKEELTEYFALHMIMNSIRKNYKKYKREYGVMIICCDGPYNWRKETFPLYKHKRKKDKKDSSIDWDFIYKNLEYVKAKIKEDFPIIVIEHSCCEADDVIGTLARYASSNEIPTIIVSNDKDFLQCHSEYVCQYRPINDIIIREPNPSRNLKELVIRGDYDDGVPNIKSPDDIFTIEGKRQSPIYKKDLTKWLDDTEFSFLKEDDLMKKRFNRNFTLIGLINTPEQYQQEIICDYVNQYATLLPNKQKMIQFFMDHRLRYMHERIDDFIYRKNA